MKTVRDIVYSIEHTKERLRNRYGIVVSDQEYIAMCAQVRDKINVEFISEEKQSGDIQQIYDMNFKGTTVRVVWSMSKQCIKTVLPM